jgi:hypothetical protein
MKKILCLFLLLIFLSSFIPAPVFFTGKIIYKYSYTDLQGKDISGKMAPILGREQHYFIDNKNYRALNERGQYIQLYTSATNTYYYFRGQAVQKIDASTPTSKKVIITKSPKKEKIAGFDCIALQMETDNSTIVYYYSEKVKIDPKTYAKHHFGEWNRYLEASGGALPLKFVMTDHTNKYIWISTASEVNKKELLPADFKFPDGYKL